MSKRNSNDNLPADSPDRFAAVEDAFRNPVPPPPQPAALGYEAEINRARERGQAIIDAAKSQNKS
jgi:hypothetical protein